MATPREILLVDVLRAARILSGALCDAEKVNKDGVSYFPCADNSALDKAWTKLTAAIVAYDKVPWAEKI
jgi:hypothetical protein